MFCTECGKELHEGDRFCANCGTKVREMIAPAYQEVVFNPPFKVEAERRTAALSREVEENTEEPKVVKTEAPSFNWNLDGFPKAEPRKTEDVDFHWESVVEKRNQGRTAEPMSWSELDAKSPASSVVTAPVVDKIEIHGTDRIERKEKRTEAVGPAETAVMAEPAAKAEPVIAAEPAVKAEPVSAAGFDTKAEPAITAEPAVTAEPAGARETEPAAKIPEPEDAKDTRDAITQLEEELFGREYRPLSSQDSDGIKNTTQLEKFYTYNEKKEAFQELLDKEYERLRAMEEDRKPDTASLEYTWASNLFPESRISERPQEAVQASALAQEPSSEMGETKSADPSNGADSAATIDFSAVREEARQQRLHKAEEMASSPAIPTEEPPVEAAAPEVQEKADIDTDIAAAAAAIGAACGAAAMAVDEDKDKDEAEVGESAEAEADAPADEQSKADAPADKEPETGKPADEEPEDEPSSPSPAEEEHAKKTKLRYSDIFPRESVVDANSGNAADGGETSVSAKKQPEGEGTASEKTNGTVNPADPGGQAAPVSVRKTGAETAMLFDDDDDEEEPPKMNIFLKIIIFILILLIVVEGLIIAVKFIAPDSTFSKKSSAVIEMIMDKLTGGGQENDADPANADGNGTDVDPQASYISEILAGLAPATTIGQVMEDPTLKYDLTKTYAFKGVSKSTEFVDSDFKTGEDGEKATYAEELIGALVSHYDQWKNTNEDTSLIGINKLEIGEIRTGQKGYFVLCRLTYAGEDGQEMVRIESSYVKLSDDSDSMVINETREETL